MKKYAIRDKRTGEISILSPTNPLIFLSKEKLESGEYLPDHVELIKVDIEVEKDRRRKPRG